MAKVNARTDAYHNETGSITPVATSANYFCPPDHKFPVHAAGPASVGRFMPLSGDFIRPDR
jgi:hypothetical protein